MQVFPEDTPENLVKAYRQFNVELDERYVPWNGDTFCNIFYWDCLRAKGIESPGHWVMPATGATVKPFTIGAVEQSANALCHWLDTYGQNAGWRALAAPLALEQAQAGRVVALHYLNLTTNPKTKRPNPGHVAMLLPDGRIIQAGARCGVFTIKEIFGALPFTYWVHEKEANHG